MGSEREQERDAIVEWLMGQAGERPSMFQDRNLARQIAAREFAYAIRAGDHLPTERTDNG